MTASAYHRILGHPLARPLLAETGDTPCQAVGGSVRDAILGLATSDLDVSIARGGGPLAANLASRIGGTAVALGGDRFASYRVVTRSDRAELWADIWDREGKSLRSDLERRDLTINSIACDLADGALYDPCGGLTDLRERRLRATRLDCFERDPLRVLRLARFQVGLDGFTIASSTLNAARQSCPRLTELAIERVRDELERILQGAAGPGFRALELVGALSVLFPGIRPTRFEALFERADRLDRGLDLVGSLIEDASWSREDRCEGALAVAVALEAETERGGPSDPRTDDGPTDAGASLEARGLATRASWRSILRLVSARTPRDPAARRLFLAGHGPRWPLALTAAWSTDAVSAEQATSMALDLDQLQRRHPELLAPVPLLDGTDTARILGISPGPRVGTALRALTREQILGRVRSRAEAEAFLRRLDLGNGEAATSPPPPGAD